MSPRYCCVPNCGNSDTKNKLIGKKIGLFRVPRSESELQLWSQILMCNMQPKTYICEKHFDSSFVFLSSNNKKRLKRSAKPTGLMKSEYIEPENIFVQDGIVVENEFKHPEIHALDWDSNQCDSKPNLSQGLQNNAGGTIACCICETHFSTETRFLKHYFNHQEIQVHEIVKDLVIQMLDECETYRKQNQLLTKNNKILKDKNEMLVKNVKSLHQKKNYKYVKNSIDDSNRTNIGTSNSDVTCYDNFDVMESKINNDNQNVSNASQINKNFIEFEASICIGEDITLFKAKDQIIEGNANNVEKEDPVCKENDPNKKNLITENLLKNKENTGKSRYFENNGKKRKLFRCHLCDKVYRSKHSLKVHLTNHMRLRESNTYKPYHCGLCSVTFVNLRHRNRHVRRYHFAKNEFKCDLCVAVKEFETKKGQTEHFLSHFKTVVKRFKCDYCGLLTNDKSHLLKHIRAHDGSNVNTLRARCDICAKEFMHKSSLNRHMRVHLDPDAAKSGKTYQCNICKKILTCQYYLKTHKRIHTNNPYQCLKCNQNFLSRKDFKLHNYVIHFKKEPIKCNFCERLYITKKECAIHMQAHNKEKPFLCSYCGRNFSSKTILQNHTRSHTGEKNFECDYCKNYFVDKSSLERHILQHTGYKPYVCQYCGKGCTEIGNLNQHIRTHTKEKPISCKICEKGFLRNSFLNQHMDKEHSNIPRQT